MELTKEHFDEQISFLNQHLDKLPTQGNLSDLKSDVEQMHSEVRSMKTDLSEIKQSIDELNARDLEDSNALAKTLIKHDDRMSRIERQLKLRSS